LTREAYTEKIILHSKATTLKVHIGEYYREPELKLNLYISPTLVLLRVYEDEEVKILSWNPIVKKVPVKNYKLKIL